MDHKTLEKQRIIEDSIGVMYLNGYNATSVKDLVDAAKIPKGSFYNYFKSKEDYAIESLRYYMSEIGADHFLILEDTKIKPLDRIMKFYRCKIDNMENEGFKLGCFLGNISQELADVNKDVSEVTNELHQEVASKILKCIKEAEVNQSFKPVIDASILADAIANSWQGALVRMKSSRNNEPLDEFYMILNEVFLKNQVSSMGNVEGV